jgi:integrase
LLRPPPTNAGMLADIKEWKRERQQQGYFVCVLKRGKPLDKRNARRRSIGACRCLGKERCENLTIHDGRHTFISHSLAHGRSLAEVRDAARHAKIATTSIYAHVLPDDGTIGNLFDTR